jgi:hypothetical protein
VTSPTAAETGSGAEASAVLGSASDPGTGVDVVAGGPATFSFANVPQVLIAWLASIPGLGDVGIEMPNNPTLPYILITQIACPDNYLWASAEIDLDLYASAPGAAIDFGRVIHARMLSLRNKTVTVAGIQVPIGHVKTDSAFSWRTYEDPLLHRQMATYTVRSSFDAQPL